MYYHKTWVRTGCKVCRKCMFSGNCSFLDTSMCTYTSMWQTGCRKTVAYFKVAHCLCTKCPTNCSHVLFPGLIYMFSLKEYEIWCVFQDSFACVGSLIGLSSCFTVCWICFLFSTASLIWCWNVFLSHEIIFARCQDIVTWFSVLEAF